MNENEGPFEFRPENEGAERSSLFPDSSPGLVCVCDPPTVSVFCPVHGEAASALAVEAIDRGRAIMAQPPGRCELCGAVKETRPYGPNGEEVCFSCGMKDKEAAQRAFEQRFSE